MQMWKDDAREIRGTWFLADADVKLYDFSSQFEDSGWRLQFVLKS